MNPSIAKEVVPAAVDWPRRRRMPDLATLDESTRTAVAVAVDLLRGSLDTWSERYLTLARAYIRDYDVLTDDEVRVSARSFMEGIVAELSELRIPDDALRDRVEELALRRAAQGVSLDTLARSYQLGSREMLALMDEIAEQAGIPSELVLAIHDSTWEFANEASAVFARVQRELSVERARFDAERRSSFARGVLAGSLPVEQIHRDAHLFGLEPRAEFVAVAARGRGTDAAAAASDTDVVRRGIAAAARVSPERPLFADMGSALGGILPATGLREIAGGPVGVSTPAAIEHLDQAFDEARLALETAEVFALAGAVRLADLGPRPLALGGDLAAATLEPAHFAQLDADARSGADIEETMRVYLECDQAADEAARRLVVHPNTVRYRVARFRQLTGLDERRTHDLVTAWWLLARRVALHP